MRREPPASSPDPGAGGAELHPVPPGQRGIEAPGLPGLRSWRAVYTVVAAVFTLWVTLLLVFMHWFS